MKMKLLTWNEAIDVAIKNNLDYDDSSIYGCSDLEWGEVIDAKSTNEPNEDDQKVPCYVYKDLYVPKCLFEDYVPKRFSKKPELSKSEKQEILNKGKRKVSRKVASIGNFLKDYDFLNNTEKNSEHFINWDIIEYKGNIYYVESDSHNTTFKKI